MPLFIIVVSGDSTRNTRLQTGSNDAIQEGTAATIRPACTLQEGLGHLPRILGQGGCRGRLRLWWRTCTLKMVVKGLLRRLWIMKRSKTTSLWVEKSAKIRYLRQELLSTSERCRQCFQKPLLMITMKGSFSGKILRSDKKNKHFMQSERVIF